MSEKKQFKINCILLNPPKLKACYLPPVADVKRGLLERASNPPGSESPLQFDAYTLNHAAFVGMNEVTCREN